MLNLIKNMLIGALLIGTLTYACEKLTFAEEFESPCWEEATYPISVTHQIMCSQNVALQQHPDGYWYGYMVWGQKTYTSTFEVPTGDCRIFMDICLDLIDGER